MPNKTLLWVLALVIVFAGGWYYFMIAPAAVTQSPNATSTPTAATSVSNTTTKTGAATTTKKPTKTTSKIVGIGTIPYLISLKQPLICSIKTTTGYSRSGTLYVANGKVRGNFVSSSMIDDGTHLYAWMTGAIKGLVLLAASSASGSAIASNGGIDLATDISFACNPWTVTASVFVPPASISFFNSL